MTTTEKFTRARFDAKQAARAVADANEKVAALESALRDAKRAAKTAAAALKAAEKAVDAVFA